MLSKTTGGLSRRDMAIIDLEREWGQTPGAQGYKLEAAKRELGLTPGGYGLILSGLVDDPHAFDYDPETISRLREVRQSRLM